MPAVGLNATIGQEEWATFVLDHLRTTSVLLRSGARYIPVTGMKAHVPRLLTDGAASWTAEGTEIVSTGATADQLILTPKKLARVDSLSVESIQDAPVSELDMVARAMAASIATAIDTAAFSAAAATSTTPAGLRSYALPTVSGTGMTLDRLITAVGSIEAIGGIARAIYVAPADMTTLRLIKDASGSNSYVLEPDAQAAGATRLAGATFFPTPALPAGTAIVAAPEQVVVGVRQDPTVQVSTDAIFTSDVVVAKVTARVDWAPNDTRGLVVVSG